MELDSCSKIPLIRKKLHYSVIMHVCINLEGRYSSLVIDNTITLDFKPLAVAIGCSKGSKPRADFCRGTAFLTNGCCKSSAAAGRLGDSRCRHCVIKSFPSSERWSGIVGRSLLFPILNIAAIYRADHANNKEQW